MILVSHFCHKYIIYIDAINFNQNFIANSRKILESNLIQDELVRHIFNANSETLSEKGIKIIDPIILQGIQLVSYVFNDLPQKIQQFIDNNIISNILESLVRRIPQQPEVITLLIKFLQTICLNPDGVKLVISSGIVDKFVAISRDSKAHRYILHPGHEKGLNYRDLIQQFCMVSQELSDQMYSALLKNFLILKEKAWEVTQSYIDMETKCYAIEQNKIQQSPSFRLEAETQKTELRSYYEKDQVALEHCFENAANFLWYYSSDEASYGLDNIISRSIQ